MGGIEISFRHLSFTGSYLKRETTGTLFPVTHQKIMCQQSHKVSSSTPQVEVGKFFYGASSVN
jgi:hypothetical protein